MTGRRANWLERRRLARLAARPCAEYDDAWAARRARTLLDACARPAPERGWWGWKEPNTHLFADFLLAREPGLRYVHVMRHGLDMAFSANKVQLALWGARLLGDDSDDTGPARALRYWLAVHERIREVARAHPGRVLLLNYDALCESPEAGVAELLDFLGLDLAEATRRALAAMPRVTTQGRYREHGLSAFSERDLERVEAFDFTIEGR